MAAKIEVFMVGPELRSSSGPSPGFHWANKPDGPEGSPRGLPVGPLPSPNFYGLGSGFPPDMPRPALLLAKQYGHLPLKDFEPVIGHFWLLSDPAKELLEALDPDGFVFLSVKIESKEVATDASSRWFCDVVRFLDAIDEEKSTMHVTDYGNGRRMVQIEDPKKTHFRRSRIGSAHIFRSVDNAYDCCCSAKFRETVLNSGLKGLGFWPAGVLDT